MWVSERRNATQGVVIAVGIVINIAKKKTHHVLHIFMAGLKLF